MVRVKYFIPLLRQWPHVFDCVWVWHHWGHISSVRSARVNPIKWPSLAISYNGNNNGLMQHCHLPFSAKQSTSVTNTHQEVVQFLSAELINYRDMALTSTNSTLIQPGTLWSMPLHHNVNLLLKLSEFHWQQWTPVSNGA